MYIQHIANITYSCFLPDLTRFISSLLPYGLTARTIIQNFSSKSKQILLEKEIYKTAPHRECGWGYPNWFLWLDAGSNPYIVLSSEKRTLAGVDFFECLRIIFIIAVTGHRFEPLRVSHLRSFKREVQDKSLLLVIHIRCDSPLLRL